MISLAAHAILGAAVIWFIVASNKAVFARPANGPAVSGLEIVYYVAGIGSVALGWYFNVVYVNEYGNGSIFNNPIVGQPSWAQYVKLMFTNPAGSSASQDYTIGNLLLLPIWTIVDGRRRGIRRPWLFFVSSLFLSFGFAWAFYLVAAERQRRHSRTVSTSAVTPTA